VVQDGRAEWSYVEHGPLLSQTSVGFQSQLLFSGAPLTSFCLVRGSPAYVRLPRISLTSPPPSITVAVTRRPAGEPARWSFYLFSSIGLLAPL
jgi:hypothetical protein